MKIFYHRNFVYEHCPDCSATGSLQRSRGRTFVEKLIKRFAFVKIFRCKNCGWRGYRFNYKLTMKSLKVIGIYIIIVFISAYIIKMILTRLVSN